MRIRRHVIQTVLLAVILLLAAAFTASADNVPRMSTDELNARLGEADLTVLDVRGSWDWNPAEARIAGAQRVNPGTPAQWAGNYAKDKPVVLYCA